jgi:hypothetical protein
MAHTPSEDLSRALIRFNAHTLALTMALIGGLGVAAATLSLLVQGGENVGSMLATLGVFFPGYRVSVGGALVGVVWAVLVSYSLTLVFARVYGSWTLRRLRDQLDTDAPPDVLGGASTLAPLALAISTGAVLALAFFVAHYWIYWRADVPGSPVRYLALLANYLPGYTVAIAGGLVGTFWVFAYGFIGAAAIAWIYNAVAALRAQIRT